jgi:hypothetical protein
LELADAIVDFAGFLTFCLRLIRRNIRKFLNIHFSLGAPSHRETDADQNEDRTLGGATSVMRVTGLL